MKKERAISVSLTNGAECICDPDIVLGDKYGIWDINNEVSPRGTLLDLNVAWELFISKQRFSSYTFEQQEDSEHERITYILVDKDKNPVGPEFTVETDNGEILVPITETITSLTAEKGKYYRLDVPVETLAITLPAMDAVTSVKKVGIYFTAGTTPVVTITAQDGKKVLYQDGYEIEADKIYRINALFNGDAWVVDALTIKIPPFFAKLTLNNGTTVELEGSGELTRAMVTPYKSSLVSVEIGKLCTSIGERAFVSCTSLTSVTIPDNVTSIGSSAFYNCTGLTSITIGSGVTYIDSLTFYNCTGLTSVTIPYSVTGIYSDAFKGCSGLTSIVVDSANTVFDSRDNCNAIIKAETNELILGCKNTVIPNTVTSIGNNAFSGSSITSITIPSNVTSIGYFAFQGCTGLTSITIGSGVTTIYGYAFDSCTSLTNIVVDSANTVFDSRDNCNAIINTSTNELILGCKNTVIPNSVTSIGLSAFDGCSGLTSIEIPDSITSICQNAFRFCSSLTSVTIPSSVTDIGKFAFMGCSGLTSITSDAMTAPTIKSDTFKGIKTGGTLIVPSGSSGYNVWMSTSSFEYYLGRYGWTKVEQ